MILLLIGVSLVCYSFSMLIGIEIWSEKYRQAKQELQRLDDTEEKKLNS